MENSEEESESGTVNQVELIKSYLSFAQQAVLRHWVVALLLFVTGLVLTGLVNAYLPRTFACSTVLMAVGSPVLENPNAGTGNPLAGASELVLRHENLEQMIRDLHLFDKVEQRRPPLLKLKDNIRSSLFGPVSDNIKMTSLVGTLETKININGTQNDLTIEADWNDPATAAELAQSAQESFLKARHSAEVSAFEEKMSILDEHAGKLREEIEQLAAQINTQTERAPAPAPDANTSADASRVARPAVARVGATPPAADEELPLLKEKLDTDKKKLVELQADRDRKLRDEQAKLAELKLRFTPEHPQVVTQGERVALASQPSSEILLLQSEIVDLTAQIKGRENLRARAGGDTGGRGNTATAGGTADPLPPAVVQALQKNDIDPALSEQLSGAVVRYGILRDDIRSGRIGLDTAQAAFNHRYQVIVPVEAPTKPKKPNPVVIWGAGLAFSLLLALVLPVLSELRRGMLLERWQVEQLQLPILAELRLPPPYE